MIELLSGQGVTEIITAVICGKQITRHRMKGQIVRVTQASRDNFSLSCIRIKAHDGRTTRVSFLTGITSRANAHVEPTIRPKLEIIVLMQTNGQITHKIDSFVVNQIPVQIAQDADLGVAGDIDIACSRLDGNTERNVETERE